MRYRGETKKLTPWNAIFVDIIFNLIGFGFIFYFSYPELKLAQRSLSWPSTEAYVWDAALNREKDTLMSFLVSYTYSVDGAEYASGKVYVGSDSRTVSTSRSIASKHYEKHKMNTMVTAYYNPKKLS